MSKKLLKDITDAVAKKRGVSKEDMYTLGADIFQEIVEQLSNGNSVMVFKFGVFDNKLTKGRDLSYFTGQDAQVKDYYTPKFVFADTIRELIKNKINET